MSNTEFWLYLSEQENNRIDECKAKLQRHEPLILSDPKRLLTDFRYYLGFVQSHSGLYLFELEELLTKIK